MRNLKRALSLALATVMTMGLMMVGTGASYQDVKATDNVEAIEVLQTVGIMTGDENGDFNPDANVTRNEIAVIMANLLNLDYDYYRGTNPFTDVPSWAAPYVAACAAEGVTAGAGGNFYNGAGNVTAAEAALMIMKALGYFQYQADFGDDWKVATVRQASYIDLFANINATAETALTRNQIAQLVLNGLKANMVSFTGDVGTEATIGNTTINIGYRAEYTPKTNASQKYNSIDTGTTTILVDNGQYFVQLGEELYNGDLELKNDTDVFGRPARYWEYDGKEIGTYAKYDLMVKEYTTKVTGKDLYDLLTSNTVDTYEFNVTIDGVSDYDIDNAVFDESSINRNNKAGVGATGNGVLTQVFVDSNAKRVDIAIINTYLAIADDDYDEKKDEIALDVYGMEKIGDEYVKTADNSDVNIPVSGEDFDVEDVVEDDLFLVTIADGEIRSMATPETLSGVEITSFKAGSNLTVDGTKYDYASTLSYDYESLEAYTDGTIINLKDMTYNVYLDQYGYAIGVVEVDVPDNYLFITGVNGNYDNLANVTYEANAIFLDGTMKTITIDSKKSDIAKLLNGDGSDATINKWFTYTVNSKDVYAVDLVTVGAGVNKLGQSVENRDGSIPDEVIDYKHDSTTDGATPTAARVYGNDKTVYLTVSVDEIRTESSRTDIVINSVDSVMTGIDNVDIEPWDHDDVVAKVDTKLSGTAAAVSSGVYTLYNKDGYIIAMVVVGEDNGKSDALVYVHSDSVSQESYDKTTEEYTWTRTVIIDGEEATLTYVDDTRINLLNKMDENKWYRVRTNADGEVVSVRASQNLTDLDYDADFNNWDLTGSYAYVANHNGNAINTAINTAGVKTVLYHQNIDNDVPTQSGKTLYLTTGHDSYIRFSDSTKVVFEQMNNNAWDTNYWTGEAGVKRAIKDLHEDTTTPATDYNYNISAVIVDGRAAVIVIRDLVEDGNSGTRPEADTENYKVVLTGSTYTLQYRTGKYSDTNTENVDTVLSMIMADLTSRGYGDFKITTDATGKVYSVQATGSNKVTRTFTWDSKIASNQEMVLITLNGKKMMVTENTTAISALATANSMTAGSYASVKIGNAAATWVPTNYWVTRTHDGAVIETGYYKVTVTNNTGFLATVDGNSVANSANAVLYLKNNQSVAMKVVGGDWEPATGAWTLISNNSKIVVADRVVSTTDNSNDTITVKLTVASTVVNDEAVTITAGPAV